MNPMDIVDNVKEIGTLVRKFNDIELNRKIVDLEGEVLDLTRDKRRADAKIEELEDLLKFKVRLVFRPPFYWAEGDATPYCAACWEVKRATVHVVFSHDNGEERRYDCPTCKQMYLIRGSGIRNNPTRQETDFSPFA